jgi:hypothetical protein
MEAAPNEQEAAWAPESAWRLWRKGESLCMSEIEFRFQDHPTYRLVTMSPELSRLFRMKKLLPNEVLTKLRESYNGRVTEGLYRCRALLPVKSLTYVAAGRSWPFAAFREWDVSIRPPSSISALLKLRTWSSCNSVLRGTGATEKSGG